MQLVRFQLCMTLGRDSPSNQQTHHDRESQYQQCDAHKCFFHNLKPFLADTVNLFPGGAVLLRWLSSQA